MYLVDCAKSKQALYYKTEVVEYSIVTSGCPLCLTGSINPDRV